MASGIILSHTFGLPGFALCKEPIALSQHLQPPMVDRRRLLGGSLAGVAGLAAGGCAGLPAPAQPFAWDPRAIAPVRAEIDRLFDITVCLRPFRAAGPRLETEMVGDKLVVHNYGHGGSGWSLSWGSGTLAVGKAMAVSPRTIGVIGCGAIGLTSALLAQRAGAQVTIYARDFLPQTRSARATGSWTPDSRIALADAAPADFGATWERMARISWKELRAYLGLPGDPVQWIDRYTVDDGPVDEGHAGGAGGGMLEFGHYDHLVRDLTPRRQEMAPGATPFRFAHVYRNQSLMFNVHNYGHTLLGDFLAAGGKVERREFHAPGDLAALPEPAIINCPGYAAREWWRDESVVPVRGQIAWLIPQPEVNYGVHYRDVQVLSRTDGMVVQAVEGGDMKGYGNADETPDRAEADLAVSKIKELFTRFGPIAAVRS